MKDNPLQSLNISRRNLLGLMMGLGLSSFSAANILQAASRNKILKHVPASKENIPVIGLGTSRTFDALHDDDMMRVLQVVLQTFFDHDGTLIDSSPMYGTAQAVIGNLLGKVSGRDSLFAATKVWVNGQHAGIEQMERSRKLWGVERFDLMQIHNLRDWKVHLETLIRMKSEGRLRYIGVTTSHGRFHEELAELIRRHPFDFVQISYNITDREVERSILPIAIDRGIAVIANRPYQRGDLFALVKGKALPDWAHDIDVTSWGQFFLKFIISHPAITCAIPATTKVKHMVDNMGAGFGRVPDANMRAEMVKYLG